MRSICTIQGLLVWLAAVGVCLFQPVPAVAGGGDQVPVLADIALMEGGLLIGQVVDPQGSVLTKVPVSLRDGDRRVAAARTDHYGCFAIRGLRGGVYQVVAGEARGVYRLWVPGTAPPSAQRTALLVADRVTVRGQCYPPGCPPLKCWLANPWVVAGIVATAVAVPVGIHNGKRPSSP